eukprot:g33960.t1
MKNLSDMDTLEKLELMSTKRSMLREDLTKVFKIMRDLDSVDKEKLTLLTEGLRSRRDPFKVNDKRGNLRFLRRFEAQVVDEVVGLLAKLAGYRTDVSSPGK